MRIALVDENLLLVDSLKNLLLQNPAYSVNTYIAGADFLQEITDECPDVAILNLSIMDEEGRDLLEECKSTSMEQMKVVVLCDVPDIHTIKGLIKRGAHGVLSSYTLFEEFNECIRAVAAGKQFISGALKDMLINSVFAGEQLAFHLSPRENEVLQRVCSGHTIKEIAYDLKLSVHTVQYYHRSVMDKMKVKRTTDLIVYAIQHKLFIPELQKQ
ncbi:LuxR C-terminal-related transcriptional regulator [Dyadobacter crusticola]|uniref:LuxR C-terminal-related transcriptional regulator n=1 Tax=Dyadobacter crusticola TaxID=292407 RepID=UPI0004E23ECF|nr:response regulator transcription factor [Dyadobacter crusticola]